MDEAPTIRRILVALSGNQEEAAWLESAAALATWLDAELATLFVEDELLLDACRLPFIREVGRVSAVVRRLEAGGLEAAFRAAAARMQRLLEQAAQRQALRYSFQIVRGRLLQTALEAARELDAVLLRGPSARPARRQPAGRLHIYAGRPPLLAVLGPNEAAPRTLAVALNLARAADTGLILALPAADEASFATARRDVQALLPARLPAMRFHRLDDQTSASLSRAAAALRPSLMVVHADPSLTPAGLVQLLAGLPCPLLLLK
jgi:hypothetical protein